MIYKDEFKYFTNVCLNLTNRCNLQCKYCFVSQSFNDMTLDKAIKAVDFLVDNFYQKKEKNLIKENNIRINFFGGEPLLLWNEIIVPLVEYSKKYNDLIIFTLTTNGLLLNEEKLIFLKKNNINFILSMDGIEKASKYRVFPNGDNSFKILNDKIKLISLLAPDTIFRMTINPETSDLLLDNYLYAIQSGFNILAMYPNCRWFWSQQNLDKLQHSLDELFTYILISFYHNIYPIDFIQMERYVNMIIQHDFNCYNGINLERKIKRNPCKVCGSGCNSAAINYEGNIYSCQEQTYNEIKKNIFYMGNLETGINIDKHKQLLSLYNEENIVECVDKNICNNCFIKFNCIEENLCLSMNYDINNNFFIKTKIDCLLANWFIERLIKMINFLMINENELIIKYLNTFYNNNPSLNFNINNKRYIKKDELDNFSKGIFSESIKTFDEAVEYFKNNLFVTNSLIYCKYPIPLGNIKKLTKFTG